MGEQLKVLNKTICLRVKHITAAWGQFSVQCLPVVMGVRRSSAF